MQICWVLGDVLVNAEDRHEVHGRCKVSEDERPENAMGEKSLPTMPPWPPGGCTAASDCCYLKDTEE